MNRKDTMDVVARVAKFYDGEPPIDVLSNELQMTERDAKLIFDRYMETQSKKVSKKRAPRKPKPAPVIVPEVVVPAPEPEPLAPPVLIAVEEPPVAEPTQVPEIVQVPPKAQEKGLEAIHELPVDLIRALSAVVAIIMLVRPIGYAIDYLVRFNSIWFAVPMALGMVVASFISPQIMVLAIRQVKYFTAAMAMVCMVIFSFLLINITVDELKYVRTASKTAVITENSGDLKAKETIKDLEAEIATDNTSLVSKKEKMEMIAKRLDGLDPSDVKYKNNYNDWLKESGEVDKLQKGIKGKQESIRETRKTIVGVVNVDTNVDTTSREETVDWLLAISQDVAGPLFLSFALFLSKSGGRRRAKTSNDSELPVSQGHDT